MTGYYDKVMAGYFDCFSSFFLENTSTSETLGSMERTGCGKFHCISSCAQIFLCIKLLSSKKSTF